MNYCILLSSVHMIANESFCCAYAFLLRFAHFYVIAYHLVCANLAENTSAGVADEETTDAIARKSKVQLAQSRAAFDQTMVSECVLSSGTALCVFS